VLSRDGGFVSFKVRRCHVKGSGRGTARVGQEGLQGLPRTWTLGAARVCLCPWEAGDCGGCCSAVVAAAHAARVEPVGPCRVPAQVVRELYLPQSGVWLCDYPFVDRCAPAQGWGAGACSHGCVPALHAAHRGTALAIRRVARASPAGTSSLRSAWPSSGSGARLPRPPPRPLRADPLRARARERRRQWWTQRPGRRRARVAPGRSATAGGTRRPAQTALRRQAGPCLLRTVCG
jgi:hypothetical protein